MYFQIDRHISCVGVSLSRHTGAIFSWATQKVFSRDEKEECVWCSGWVEDILVYLKPFLKTMIMNTHPRIDIYEFN